MSPKQKKQVNLALQGGGAHGAFTWGILDKFLEEDIFDIEGISATSAGSMNAVVLAQGLMAGGNEGARQCLEQFWRAMSEHGEKMGMTAHTPMDFFLEPFLKVPVSFYFYNAMMSVLSPYQFNPMNYHPIREVLENIVNVEQLKKHSKLKLFICATNVKTGKIRIFNEDELSIDAVLASACLPKLFQAVEIDNEFYWDGGYLGNPAIFPLIYETDVTDIIILHTVPIVRDTIPTTVVEVDSRLREISFNSSLMREMRAIAFVTKLIDQGWVKEEFMHHLRRLYVHCLRADQSLLQYPAASIYVPDWQFLTELKEKGRKAADIWIKENYAAIGHKTTIDFEEWL